MKKNKLLKNTLILTIVFGTVASCTQSLGRNRRHHDGYNRHRRGSGGIGGFFGGLVGGAIATAVDATYWDRYPYWSDWSGPYWGYERPWFRGSYYDYPGIGVRIIREVDEPIKFYANRGNNGDGYEITVVAENGDTKTVKVTSPRVKIVRNSSNEIEVLPAP